MAQDRKNIKTKLSGQELAPRGRAILEQLSRMAKEDVVPGYNEVGSPELALKLLQNVEDYRGTRDYGSRKYYLEHLSQAASNPEAQILTALLVDPKLIKEYKSDLDQWLGTDHVNQSGSQRLSQWSKALTDFISSYAGMSDFVRFGAISLSAAPRGRALLADLHRRYAGLPAVAAVAGVPATAADAPAVQHAPAVSPPKTSWGQPAPEPALAWPIERAADATPRVLSVQKSGRRWRVNGKDAETIDESSPRSGLAESVLVHPEDPDVIVKLYHSPGSLAAHERKEARVDSLRLLSAAGATPTLIEHGEATVPGAGRVYFYAQRRARGRKLGELESWPASAVSSLVERIKRSSLLLALPAPAREWLLSHVVVEDGGEGAPRAYLLGADAVPAEPSRAEDAAALVGSYLAPEKRETPAAKVETAAAPISEAQALAGVLSDDAASPAATPAATPPAGTPAVPASPLRFWPAAKAAEALDEKVVGIAATFQTIPKGKFQMGSPAGEANRRGDEAQHEVTIKNDFEMQKTPMTWGQLLRIVRLSSAKITIPAFAQDPKNSDGGKRETLQGIAVNSDHPVVNVSWDDAQEIVDRLNKIQDEYTYRLPTEAEWEYAARAGSQVAYPFKKGKLSSTEKELQEHGWYSGNSGTRTHAVGKKKANKFGLYDTLGNVWEWVQDGYGDYKDAPTDGSAQEKADPQRVVRGGSWGSDWPWLRPAYRGNSGPAARFSYVGLRLVRSRR